MYSGILFNRNLRQAYVSHKLSLHPDLVYLLFLPKLEVPIQKE